MHADHYLKEVVLIADQLDRLIIEDMVDVLAGCERIFLLGLGGSAANCSHAAADFRRLCGKQAYTPVDSMAEFSASANDEGWPLVFEHWLRSMHAGENDALIVMSVGGGTMTVSQPITQALAYATANKVTVLGLVGPNGGATADFGDLVLKVPAPDKRVTPHTEAFQAVIWHLFVSHPKLQRKATKW